MLTDQQLNVGVPTLDLGVQLSVNTIIDIDEAPCDLYGTIICAYQLQGETRVYDDTRNKATEFPQRGGCGVAAQIHLKKKRARSGDTRGNTIPTVHRCLGGNL